MKFEKNILPTPSTPLTIIDIGARQGVHQRWQNIIEKYPLDIIGFEPDMEECDRLNRQSSSVERYLPHAVFSRADKRTFYLTESKGNYTLFKPDNEYINRFAPRDSYIVNKTIELDVVSLDSVMSEQGVQDVDYIKMDAEGGELEIIKGANKTLKTVFSVELEAWFNRINENAPLFSDIDMKMRELGFVLFDVARDNFVKRIGGKNLGGPKGQLWSGDMLYFRDIANLEDDSVFWDRDKMVKGIILAMSYGYYDYALEMIGNSNVRSLFNEIDRKKIEHFITVNGKRIGLLKGRYRLSKFLERLARRVSIQESDYLGNW